MKSGGFHLKSSRFQVQSTHNLIKSDVSTKTIQFDECRRGAMTLDFMKSGVIAPSMHPPNWRVFVETSDFIRLWVDFTWNADFMKSAGFHVKLKDHLQGIVTLCFIRFLGGFHEIWWISKDQLPGMVTPMFLLFYLRLCICCNVLPPTGGCWW